VNNLMKKITHEIRIENIKNKVSRYCEPHNVFAFLHYLFIYLLENIKNKENTSLKTFELLLF
jgi:hypothetical protein